MIFSWTNFRFKFFTVIFCGAFSLSAGAKGLYLPEKESCKGMMGTDLVYQKKNKLLVYEYKPQTDTFILLNPEAPGEVYMSVTLSGLAAGISKVKKNWDTIIKNPEDIVGEIYVGEEDVPSLTEKELAARKNCSRVKP